MHYVVVDDKLRILAATKKAWGDRVTNVFPRQGKFANDPKVLAAYPPENATALTGVITRSSWPSAARSGVFLGLGCVSGNGMASEVSTGLLLRSLEINRI